MITWKILLSAVLWGFLAREIWQLTPLVGRHWWAFLLREELEGKRRMKMGYIAVFTIYFLACWCWWMVFFPFTVWLFPPDEPGMPIQGYILIWVLGIIAWLFALEVKSVVDKLSDEKLNRAVLRRKEEFLREVMKEYGGDTKYDFKGSFWEVVLNVIFVTLQYLAVGPAYFMARRIERYAEETFADYVADLPPVQSPHYAEKPESA